MRCRSRDACRGERDGGGVAASVVPAARSDSCRFSQPAPGVARARAHDSPFDPGCTGGAGRARLSPAPPPERSSLSQLLARRVHSTAMFNRVHCCQQRPPVPATSPLAARILSQLDQLPKAPGWDDKPYCPPGAFGTCLGNCINPGARDWKGGHASQPAWSGGLQGTFEASVCVQRAGCAQAGVPGIVPAGLAASRGSQARPHPVYENSGLHACCCYNMDCKTSQASKRPAAWRLQQAGGRLSWGGIADPCSYY